MMSYAVEGEEQLLSSGQALCNVSKSNGNLVQCRMINKLTVVNNSPFNPKQKTKMTD